MKRIKYSILLLTIIIFTSCNSKSREGNSPFVEQLTQLDEYRFVEQKADSFKKAGANVEIKLVIMKDSPFPEDSLKNLSVGFIEWNFGPDELLLYKVKFDKHLEKIISVEKTHTEADLAKTRFIIRDKKTTI